MKTLLKSPLFVMLTVTTLLTACGGEVEDTRPGQPVKQRQQAFKDILRSFEPMGTMLRTNRYEADKFTALAADLYAKRNLPWVHFAADTNYPPTKSTPEVWLKPEQFEEKKQVFVKAVEALKAATPALKATEVESAYQAVHDSCKGCHQTFKQR